LPSPDKKFERFGLKATKMEAVPVAAVLPNPVWKEGEE
jgi:hypothetical protein